MIHFIPESPETATPVAGPYAEAVARLASIRQALACVEQVSGEAPSDRDSEARLAVRWPGAAPAARRCFDSRSHRAAQGAAAGLEAIAAHHDRGEEANPAATDRLRREIADSLDGIDLLFSL